MNFYKSGNHAMSVCFLNPKYEYRNVQTEKLNLYYVAYTERDCENLK